MKIKVMGYPQTFEFEIKSELPEFQYICEVREKYLRQAMEDQNIDSPCHAYEDYVIEQILRRNGKEYWYLGS